MTKSRTGHTRVQIPTRARVSSFLQTAQIGPVVHPTSFSLGTGILSRGKRPGSDADNSPSHSAEGKNEWSCVPVPPICLHGVNRYCCAISAARSVSAI